MTVKDVRTDLLVPGKTIRSDADEEIGELMESIERHDLLQPIVVRPAEGGKYEIIAGMRRYRAMVARHEPTVACLIRDDISDADIPLMKLAENIQRKQMSAHELVAVFEEMMQATPGLTRSGIARLVGKSTAWVQSKYKADKVVQSLLDAGVPLELVEDLTDKELADLGHVHDNEERAAVAAEIRGKNRAQRKAVVERAKSFRIGRKQTDYGREEMERTFQVFYAGKRERHVFVMCRDKQWRDTVVQWLYRLYGLAAESIKTGKPVDILEDAFLRWEQVQRESRQTHEDGRGGTQGASGMI